MNLQKKVEQTLKKIKINKKDKILVALSGGKDSSVTAYFLKKLGYNISGFYIDLKIGKYSEENLKNVKKLCESLNITLYVYDIKKSMNLSMKNIFSKIKKYNLNNCAVCGVIKKYIMNKEARKLKVKYLATGHNLDDEAQTFFMNILKGAPELSANSGVITKNISNKKFISRIKPLFYIPEEEIKKFSKLKKFPVIYEKCPYLTQSYRKEIRKLFENFSDKEKLNLIKNLEKIQANFKKVKNSNINYCEICEEPTRKTICKKCELLKKIYK